MTTDIKLETTEVERSEIARFAGENSVLHRATLMKSRYAIGVALDDVVEHARERLQVIGDEYLATLRRKK